MQLVLQQQKLVDDLAVVAELELERVVLFVHGPDLVFAVAALVHGSERAEVDTKSRKRRITVNVKETTQVGPAQSYSLYRPSLL